MPRTIAQLKTDLQSPNADLATMRQAALELADHLDQLVAQFNQFYAAYNNHGHAFSTTDTNGRDLELSAGQIAPIPSKGNLTTVGLHPNAAPGAAVKLSKPRRI